MQRGACDRVDRVGDLEQTRPGSVPNFELAQDRQGESPLPCGPLPGLTRFRPAAAKPDVTIRRCGLPHCASNVALYMGAPCVATPFRNEQVTPSAMPQRCVAVGSSEDMR